jgi:hypothetical protein
MVATQTSYPQDGRHPQDGNPPSFESVWALMDRVGERLDKVGERLDKVGEKHEELVANQKETDRLIKELRESQKETDRIVKETSKQIGSLHNRFGEIVEYMVAPNLREKFWDMGLKFNQANTDAVFSENKVVLFEVDILLENGDKAMLVETKTTFTTEDVREHIELLEKMRKYADLHGDKRVFLGAVAGVVMTSQVKKYALKQGFYVIEPSGETFNIISPSGQPKEW